MARWCRKAICIAHFTSDCTFEFVRRITAVTLVEPRTELQEAPEISKPQPHYRVCGVSISFLTIVAVTTLILPGMARAAEPSQTQAATEKRVHTLIPEIEAYIASGMKGFDVPGLAIGIVAGDRLVYAKGFGARSKSSGLPVDTRTIFQIGSNTKAFLAATEAIMVDGGKLRWDDRVVDRYPEFQLKDPWVTREFRLFDLLAQRSGLPPLVNDILSMLNFKEGEMIRSLRYVEPVSSFRTTFAYTNITHLASRIVAEAAGAPDWNAVLQKELLDPLGMKESTYTVEAIETAPNHANGHRWTPGGTIEVPFTPIFPYHLAGSGTINSNIEDMARWVRMQLGNGEFDGRRIVSSENLAYTRRPMVAVNEQDSYDLAWHTLQTPNGNILWHDGDALSFGSFVGLVPDKNIGIIILTNETNVQAPNSLGAWVLGRILGENAKHDPVAENLKNAKANFAATLKLFAKPASPRPFPRLAPLTGNFVNPSFGKAMLTLEGDALVIEFRATGAKFKLVPWDGDIFIATLMATGQFGPIVDLDYMIKGFAQFQMDKDGKLNLLRLSIQDGQAYEFRRE